MDYGEQDTKKVIKKKKNEINDLSNFFNKTINLMNEVINIDQKLFQDELVEETKKDINQLRSSIVI